MLEKCKISLTIYKLCFILIVKLTLQRRDSLENKVEQYRKEIGETQEELAYALQVSRQTIISIEKGKYNPSIILAFKIATHFKRRIEEIFIYKEENSDKENET